MDDSVKTLCLTEELTAAHELIVSGFGELQQIRMDNDFYHLPHQLLTSGFERLLKCYFCAVYEAKEKRYPDFGFLKKLGHDLQKLKQTLVDDYFATNNVQLVCEDFEYLKNDLVLNEIVRILSEFGKKARYYNLDIVTGSNNPPIDPDEEWEALERDIVDPLPYISSEDGDALYRDYYPKVNAIIVGKLEQMFRAVAMQFTRGNHGGRLRQLSPILGDFLIIRNDSFGTNDYRRSVKESKLSKDTWCKRTQQEALNSRWPSSLVTRDQFAGDWPFRYGEVVVECQEKIFCVVNIEGYDFALNGSANSRFGYPFPHDVGLAILGKSVGPFIDMAHELGNE